MKWEMAIMSGKKWCSVTFTSLAMLATLSLYSVPSAEAASKEYNATATSQQKKPNQGINKVLSPDLSCGKTEKNNNVTKGALYGAGTGMLVGGPVGAVVGAGTGAAVQQAQNKDACGK
jgi:uncharacterized protein (DUF39 family)